MTQAIPETKKFKSKINSDESEHSTTNTKLKINSNSEPILNNTVSSTSCDSPSYNHSKSSRVSAFIQYLPLIIATVSILIFILFLSTAFSIINANSSKIVDGVSINGINVSGLTKEEATQKLFEHFSHKLNSNLNLIYEDYTTQLIPSQDIDAKFNIPAVIEAAYSIGRSGNFIQNNYEILESIIATKQIHINLEYDSEKLNNYVDTLSVELPGLVEHPSYYIENQNLIIVRGTAGIELLQSQTQNLIISNLENLSVFSSINLPVQNVEPYEIDISKIHQEIYSEPQNAYIVQDPFELFLGSSGTDFAISLDESKNLILQEQSEYIIPLKLTEPEISIKDLGNEIFIDNLGTFSSKYQESNTNRSTNVKLASAKINDVILLPGEEFSYNKIVGKRTIESGFKEASIYTSAGVVNGLGGGICQVSSTLYNSVLRANLEITERRNHSYAVSYVPLGTDATVSYGSIDFKFKNNRKYPIKIVASSYNGVCTVNILGIKEDIEYEVEITPKKLQTIPFQTKYIEDSSIPNGTQKQTQYGDYGYKYETYKTLKLNGNIISTELLSTDNYKPLNRIIKINS